MRRVFKAGAAAKLMFAAIGQESSAADRSLTFFSGVEAEHRTVFATAGGKISLRPGPEFGSFVLLSTGVSLSDLSRARRGEIAQGGVNTEARLFAGVERSAGMAYGNAAVGPSLVQYIDRTGRERRRAGVALHADLWLRPDETQLFTATVIADSAQPSLWTRLRYGWRTGLLPGYLGIEASASLSSTTRKIRLGVMLAEWRIGPVTAAFSAGWMRDRRLSGPYGAMTAYINF